MAYAKLKKTGKEYVRDADWSKMRDYFVGMPGNERQSKWVRVGNRYRVDCTGRYGQDRHSGSVDVADLVAYIAASTPGHVTDGWSLLGRAVDSALRRDQYAAVHFGYYAELRGAMALCAAEGIGVFNNKHPVVRRNGSIADLPKVEIWQSGRKLREHGGTHQVVWPYLRHWSTLRKASDLLDEIVRPAGTALSDWLNVCGANAPTRAIAKSWLKAWGLDLSKIDEDRNIRNLGSYRPSEFRLPPSLPVDEVLEFVESLWRLFEPSESSRFPVLERYLLRRAFHLGNQNIPIASDIEQLGFSGSEAAQWVTFLSNHNDPTPLNEAEKDAPIEDARCHLQIISRAALLLFLATSSCRRLLQLAGYTQEDLAFWWERLGRERGIWDDHQPPESALDLWADVQTSLDDVRDYRNNG